MKCNGLSPAGIKAAFSPLARDKPGFPNPHGEPLMALVRRMHQHQLYPGDNLKDIEARFLAWFDRNLQLPVLQRDCVDYAVLKNSASVNVPLLPWCSEFFTRAGEVAYFGDTMGQIDPKLAETFLEFDELSWQILYQYPAVLTRTLNKNRHRLLSAFKEYIQIPKSQRRSQAWFMAAFEDELRSLDVNDADIATMLLTKYWVLVITSPTLLRICDLTILTSTYSVSTNTRKALFWLLTYLLYNPQHIDAIRAETSSAFQGDTLVDPRYLQEQCPHLDAVWYETLRMASNSASVRPVQKDTVIGGKTLRKGSRILVPYRLLHFDERVFGAEIDAFKPERFLGKAKALTQCSSWRPFGGGKTMCTGRYVAKNTVTAFVSVLVRRFDISLVGNPSIPEADLGRPVLGIMAPKDAQHLVVTIAPRSLKV